ncbi:GNAT family N-acetyltransferase [Bacillus atrophaeus]|uniref:Protein involved in maturation of the outermost layer of the spore n=1 Tax=Bacillus atrophaeus (strain 1942) TaxID=720555 RepID=A0ABM5LY88_BACA1|nr:GNAT family N-acetyltransferase [Bacillus atrophaeus]AMR62534.1 acetyltransferase [Bacillus subtilis subsp. globigii]ADP32654.1 protein involved in maturation of the outermost layer of the spore [Bacillus atrophaeus 1942]AIK48765.1 acetyltransferase family protein [Bacillus atrophaeus subsp. globigii]AKL84816.1 CgeE [Bacillus atrophaeus UCMB-5137]EIM11888.1 protein involved in maturation of the outermost layer of the spore [Bacillus atrophaeus C89]
MTEHYSKTEKQYLSLTSVFKPFEQYSVYSDPDLPQIFSHNFVQLRASFPLNSLLSFLPSVSGLLNTNYIHLKASPQHTFPLVLKQSLVKNGFVVEDELFYSIQLDHWGKRAGHPLTGWGTKKSLADGSSIMKIYDSLYISEAIAEKKLQRKYPFYQSGKILLVVCYSDSTQKIPIGCGELFINSKEKTAKIEEVAILDQFQRKGYGTILIGEMLSAAKAFGMHSAYLVTSSLDGAGLFYEKLRFEKYQRMHTVFHYFLT